MSIRSAVEKRTWHGIPPDRFLGQIVQISLDIYELAGPHIFIPPLLISDCVPGVHKKTSFSKLSFLGILQGDIEGYSKSDSDFSKMRTVTFFNSEPDLQPQFLTDPDFMLYLNHHNYSVPVRVYGSTTQRQTFGEGEEADSDAFFYVGWGIVQVFRPGIGFEQDWDENDPWLKKLRKVEADLLKMHPREMPS